MKREQAKQLVKSALKALGATEVTAAYRITFTDFPADAAKELVGQKVTFDDVDMSSLLNSDYNDIKCEGGDWGGGDWDNVGNADIEGVIDEKGQVEGTLTIHIKWDSSAFSSSPSGVKLDSLINAAQRNGADWSEEWSPKTAMMIGSCNILSRIHKTNQVGAEIVPLDQEIMVRYIGDEDFNKCREDLKKAGFKWEVGG